MFGFITGTIALVAYLVLANASFELVQDLKRGHPVEDVRTMENHPVQEER